MVGKKKKKPVLTPSLRRSGFSPDAPHPAFGQPNLGLAILPLPRAKDTKERETLFPRYSRMERRECTRGVRAPEDVPSGSPLLSNGEGGRFATVNTQLSAFSLFPFPLCAPDFPPLAFSLQPSALFLMSR